MPDETKSEEKPAKSAPRTAEPTVTMQHETYRYVHRMAIGEEWFDVKADGIAEFPLRLREAAELAGFRRVA